MLWCVWCLSDVQSDFLGFPPLPSCLVNHADISWFWQIWHIYEAGYLSAQQEQKSVSFISLAYAAARSLGEIFRIFQICNILLLDEWQYILSLVICSIIQHWWLILIVGGWLIVAMLQYVMAAHTDPSPAATSSAAPSHLILLFLHSHLLLSQYEGKCKALFSVANSSDFEQKQQQTTKKQNDNNNNKQTNLAGRERWTGGDSQQRLLCPST